MAIVQFFKMAAVRHLGFSKVGNFNFRSHSEAQYVSPYQISRRLVKQFRRYGRFSIFQDGGRRHFGFLKFQNFKRLKRSRGSNCVCMQNFVEIAQTAAEIWRFLDFLDPQKAHPWAETRRMTYRSSK